ncbi:MAG: SDR family oxidoreductase [Myxococcota bacterium]
MPVLDGSTVLLTGASSGIGLELARLVAARASRLIIVARRRDRLETLRDELVAAHPKLVVDVETCDLSDLAATEALADGLLARLDAVDVLINNAGLGDIRLFEVSEHAKLQRMIAVNIEAVTLLTHKLVPPMVQRGRGGVLFISSGFGLTVMPGVAAYAGTKHYVSAFSEALRMELRGTGVVVTQVCPGPVATEFESVAGNPTGQSVPKFIELSPEKCAALSIRGFDRRRATVVPGFVMSILMWFGVWMPRWSRRAMYSWMATFLRNKQGLKALGSGDAG